MKRIASVRDSTTLFCLRTFKAIMYNNVRSEISSKQTLRKLWVYFCFNQYINLVYFQLSYSLFYFLLLIFRLTIFVTFTH